jgi:multidrug efflux system membrane fusion protein
MLHSPRYSTAICLTLVAAMLVAAHGLIFTGCTRSVPPAAPAPTAAEVTVTLPQLVRVPEYLEVTGRIDAELLVDIRSRITGYLTKVAFRDGQFVKKGDLLYEIDVRPYAAQLATTVGTIEKLVGERRFLEVQVDRYGKLVAKGAASRARTSATVVWARPAAPVTRASPVTPR